MMDEGLWKSLDCSCGRSTKWATHLYVSLTGLHIYQLLFFRISSIIPAPTSYWSLLATCGNIFNSHTLASQQDGAKVWQSRYVLLHVQQTGWMFPFSWCEHWNGTISFKLCFLSDVSCDFPCRYASAGFGVGQSAVFLFWPSRRPPILEPKVPVVKNKGTVDGSEIRLTSWAW